MLGICTAADENGRPVCHNSALVYDVDLDGPVCGSHPPIVDCRCGDAIMDLAYCDPTGAVYVCHSCHRLLLWYFREKRHWYVEAAR